MAVQDFIHLVQDEEKVAQLKSLVERQYLINKGIEQYKKDKEEINTEVKFLGIKIAEFNKAVKYIKDDGDLLMNELSLLECINDHLVEDI